MHDNDFFLCVCVLANTNAVMCVYHTRSSQIAKKKKKVTNLEMAKYVRKNT